MAFLDPITRDLVRLSSGDLKPSSNPTLEGMALRLRTRRGTCWWDVTFGSTLHELGQAKITRTFAADVEDRIRTALQPMIDEGEVSDLAFEHERPETNRWHTRLACRDAAQRPLAWDVWVEVS